MEFLRLLEGIRTPFGDAFFSIVTHLGEETFFIVVGLLLFWCIDKKQGYFVMSVGFLGTVINQFLKLTFRIPRPWVKDPSFTIVESARAEATGYSFPSGHTQSAVGTFGSIGRICKVTWVRVLCILACILVPISRMYLGVHTPADVIVSLVVALVLIFVLYPIMNYVIQDKKRMRIYMGCMVVLSALFLIYVLAFPFPADIDASNYASGVKNAYKILGCILGLWLAYEVDEKHTHFETKAVWWAQIIKLAVGLGILLGIKSGVKPVLNSIFNGNYVADGIRYFLIVVFAGVLWPMTFRWFSKLGKGEKK